MNWIEEQSSSDDSATKMNCYNSTPIQITDRVISSLPASPSSLNSQGRQKWIISAPFTFWTDPPQDQAIRIPVWQKIKASISPFRPLMVKMVIAAPQPSHRQLVQNGYLFHPPPFPLCY